MRHSILLAALAASAPAVLCAGPPQYARRAMVVTREAHATDAGLAVLKSGGNAIDAAVAAGFALAVTHPSAGNLGGGGFLLARFADGRATFLDFRERAPLAASRDMYLAGGRLTAASQFGYLAAGVPGTVRGLEYAHRKYGRKPWADLVTPAVELAGKGFPISFQLARALRGKCDLLEPFPESRRIFLNKGLYHDAGGRLVQEDLARTLDRIRRQGAKDFYEGETARLLAADMQAHGGLITLEDLKSYQVVERAPLAGAYRGYGILTAPPPSSGGVGILQMLAMLEPTGFEKHGAGSAASIHMLAEAMRRYFADRAEHLADPDFARVPVSSLLDPKYVAARRASIDPERATPSAQVRPGAVTASAENSETTHYTIVDAEGNVVALTYTLNGSFGAGVTATGLGFLLNNEMDDFSVKPGSPNLYGVVQGEANAIQPRKHPLSSMAPTIVTRDGRFWFAAGSPGGPTIINTVLQVLVNVIDFRMKIQDAVDWPRIHHQWMPDELRLERGRFSPDTIALLEKRGHRVRFVDSQGEVAGVWTDGVWFEGAADSRVEAAAKGY